MPERPQSASLALLSPGEPLEAEAYLEAAGLRARPQVRQVLLNMVSTADGRASLDGRSGSIGGPPDRALFHALRSYADAVLVGAGTVRVERYGPMIGSADARRRRVDRGLAAQPLACIVSASLDLDPSLPLLADAESHVVVITSAEGDLAPCAAQVEYIRAPHGEGGVDLARALDELGARHDAHLVLCEGGPHLGAELLRDGLLDELWLSIGPRLGGDDPSGVARRILAGRRFPEPVELELLALGRGGSELFLRYGVVRSPEISRATTD